MKGGDFKSFVNLLSRICIFIANYFGKWFSKSLVDK
jgi:hypothetical protein